MFFGPLAQHLHRPNSPKDRKPLHRRHNQPAPPARYALTVRKTRLDRLCAASHRIAMKGPSQRKRQPGPTDDEETPDGT